MVQLTTSYTGRYSFHRAYAWWVPRQLIPELKGRDVDTCLLSYLSLQICGHGLFKWHLWHGTCYFEHHPYAWCRYEHILPDCNYIWCWISVGWLLSLSLYQIWVPGVFPGGKGGRCVRLTTLPSSCVVVTKSGNLNFLRTLWACPGL